MILQPLKKSLRADRHAPGYCQVKPFCVVDRQLSTSEEGWVVLTAGRLVGVRTKALAGLKAGRVSSTFRVHLRGH
jgi:hypothetical protein